LAGVLVISFEAPIKTSAPLNQFRGIIYGVSSVFLTALGIVIMKPILEQQPFFWSSSLRFLAGIAGMLAYLRWFGDWQKSFSHIQAQQHWPRVLLASVLGGYLAMMLWLAGYKFTDASVAAILNETTSIFIVFLAWLLLKEALTLRKLIGSMFAFLGVYMVLMS
jgi:drug/metabolite transporter (DMT)-like permease